MSKLPLPRPGQDEQAPGSCQQCSSPQPQ